MAGFDGATATGWFNPNTGTQTNARAITLEDGRKVTASNPPSDCKCCKCTQACCHSVYGIYAQAITASADNQHGYGLLPFSYDTYANAVPDWVWSQSCRSLNRCLSEFGGPGQFAATPEICKARAIAELQGQDVLETRYLPCDCDDLDLCGYTIETSFEDFDGSTAASLDLQFDSATGRPKVTQSRNVAFTPFSPLELEGKTISFNMQTSGSVANTSPAGFRGIVSAGCFFSVSGRVVGNLGAIIEGKVGFFGAHPWEAGPGGGVRSNVGVVNVAQHLGNTDAIRARLPLDGTFPPYFGSDQRYWAIGDTIGWSMSGVVTISNITRGPDCTWLGDINVNMSFTYTGTDGGSNQSINKDFSQVQLLPDSFENEGDQGRCRVLTPFIALWSGAAVQPNLDPNTGTGNDFTVSGNASTSANVPFDRAKNVFPGCETDSTASNAVQEGEEPEPVETAPTNEF